MDAKPLVVIGMLGTTLDVGHGPKRWSRWRPTVDLCRHDEFLVDRLELLHPPGAKALARIVTADIAEVAPETEVRLHRVAMEDPWDFQEVFGTLYDFAQAYPWDPDTEDYLVNITTGTHVAQICFFLLAESRHYPARLLQLSPPRRGEDAGTRTIIDLDLSRYDALAARFHAEHAATLASLKSGIETRNAAFNALIAELERVVTGSRRPILLTGPTGAGKSHLARRMFELARARDGLRGPFVEVNCATLRGDGASAALFGHTRGAFTGAHAARPGLLRAAHGGVLFLDEIGELGLDEQAMLLRAVEEREFLPVGSEQPVRSDFRLIAGTNRDLEAEVRRGGFRHDLLARINLWTFRLPGLADRREDIAPNLEYELAAYARESGRRVTMNAEARRRFLTFAESPTAGWKGNFRDLNAAVVRMAVLAPGGRITEDVVATEVDRLTDGWARLDGVRPDIVAEVLGPDAELDRFDRAQLAEVVRVCRESPTLSAAGRALFAVSRAQKQSRNDADRLRKYLARFGLTFEEVSGVGALDPRRS